jgi:alkylated DNA repair dioxygenase AlkB
MALTHQASLFGDGAPRPQASPITRRELAGGAWIDHAPGWLDGHETVFEELVAAAPWSQKRRRMYEGMVDEPRLTAWYRLDESTAGLPTVLLEVRDLLADRYGKAFSSIGCNLYRDGHDSVAWHGDTVRRTQAEPIVAILSLGEPRKLLLRPTGGGRSIRYDLGAGDLFVMGGTCQHTWQHSVPKVTCAGPRISVTYRHGPDAEY